MSRPNPCAEPLAPQRDTPCHYTLTDLPREFADFETPVEGLGVGQPGKVGLLELDFAPRGGVSRLTRHFQQFPLQVFRPVYLDPHRPDMPFVYVMSHGGTVQGDRYRLDLACAAGGAAHVTTQSAVKLYRMDRNYATQLVRLTAGRDSFLEYLPDPVIPFRGTRFFGRTLLSAHPTATVIAGEVLLAGRAAHGECHDYACYASHFEARSSEGELWFSDAMKFAPQYASPQSPGTFSRYTALASLYVVTRRVSARLLSDRMHACLAEHPQVVGGASELPNDSGVWLRALGTSCLEVSAAFDSAWNAARLALIGAPAPNRRKT
ncbi:MAG TPA: urease accessory protein UreD [Pirellulales bacterium]|nr:urease accessory protein UreD [Pirellulales bacterium]